jgi:pimeloyl-ACP methyl ester carboxylesterase
LTSGISRLFFKNRKNAARSLKYIFPILPRDFEIIVDEVYEESTINGAKASDWQNGSIGFLKMNINLLPELHRISCPALFIQGDKDNAVNPKFTKEAASKIQNAKLVILENHGHWPNRQSPEKVNLIILEFLNCAILTEPTNPAPKK